MFWCVCCVTCHIKRERLIHGSSSPYLSKNWSCSEGGEHRPLVRSSNHLHLPCFDDVHLPTYLTLSKTKIRGRWCKAQDTRWYNFTFTIKRLHKRSVLFCRHNHQAGRQLNVGFWACRKSSVCHNPAKWQTERNVSVFLTSSLFHYTG